MPKILAIANVKGGVGKTTTVVNLAAALAERGARVLAIDLDPQASLTLSLGLNPEDIAVTVRQLFDAPDQSSPILSTGEQWDVIPANAELRELEHELETLPQRIPKVAAALLPLRDQYDYILLDCPASTGALLGAALAAADQVIIPLTPDYLAFRVTRALFRIVEGVQKKINPRLRIGGIFLTMYDSRTRHARDFMTMIRETYTDVHFFSAVIRHSVKVKEAPAFGQSVIRYAPQSQAANAYRVIAAEIEQGIGAAARRSPTRISLTGQAAPAQVSTVQSPREPLTIEKSESGAASPDAPPTFSNLPDFIRKTMTPLSLSDYLLRAAQPIFDPNREPVGELEPPSDYLAYRQATEADPADVGAWIARAVTAPGGYEALYCWAHALELDPTNESVQDELDAQLDRRLNLSTALELPRLLEIAQALVETDLKSRAALVYSRITELDMQCQAAWLGWARVTSDPLERISFLQHVLELDPSNPTARAGLEAARQSLRAEAEQLLEQGAHLTQKNHLAEAHILFKQAIDLDPTDDRAWLGCARTVDDLVSKLNYLKQALKLNPRNQEAKELYGIISNFMNGSPREQPVRANSRHWQTVVGLVLLVLIVSYFLIALR